MSPPLELTPAELIARIPYLAALPADGRAVITRAWQRHEAVAGEMILVEGAPSAGLYAIAAGQVRIFKLSPEGRAQGLHCFGPGATFNDVSALDGGPNPANALALEDVVLYHLDCKTLHGLLDSTPALARALVPFLAQRVRTVVEELEALAFRPVAARLARLLLAQAAHSDGDAATLSRRRWLTQQEMAIQLGTAREVVGRLLRRFRDDGLIQVSRRRIKILDHAGLARLAEDP